MNKSMIPNFIFVFFKYDLRNKLQFYELFNIYINWSTKSLKLDFFSCSTVNFLDFLPIYEYLYKVSIICKKKNQKNVNIGAIEK